MGKPSRNTPTVVIRPDGTVYSSHRIRHRGLGPWTDRATPTLELPPTEPAIARLGHITRTRRRQQERRAQR
jgi:hypothetical protein